VREASFAGSREPLHHTTAKLRSRMLSVAALEPVGRELTGFQNRLQNHGGKRQIEIPLSVSESLNLVRPQSARYTFGPGCPGVFEAWPVIVHTTRV
jgi:hypothetical protein